MVEVVEVTAAARCRPYEPPQEGKLDGLTLGLPWEDEPRIRDLSKSASTPLTIVGYIFTDLDPTPEDRTKNLYKRHPGSFFLSSLETIFSATPVSSRSSPTGTFPSRLVTAVVTVVVVRCRRLVCTRWWRWLCGGMWWYGLH